MPIEQQSLAADVLLALRMFPPTLRTAVLAQPVFQKRFDITGTPVLTLEPSGAQFLRQALFGAARHILSGEASSVELRSMQGAIWNVKASSPFGVELAHGEVVCSVPEMSCMAPDSATRTGWLDQQVGIYAAVDSNLAGWRKILEERPLTDEEIEPLLDEVAVTPPRVFASIRQVLAGNSFGPAHLVPSDARYFERLAGVPSTEESPDQFFATTLSVHVRRLADSGSAEGLKTAFLLASHSRLADLIDIGTLPRQLVLDAFAWVASNGDRVSQVGAIECGMRLLREWPELEPSLARLIQEILADQPDDPGGRLELSSCLTALVEGEVARSKIARGRPPFWRRLGSIAHASALEREVIHRRLDSKSLAAWAIKRGGALYYMQTLVDLREEPRWFPDFISPHQLQAEWIGRVWSAAERDRDSIPVGVLSELLWGEGAESVRSRLSLPQAWLPGPLEGGTEAVRELPADLETNIRASLEAEELTTESFIGLVSASLILRVDGRLSGLAAQGLRRVGYQLRRIGTDNDPFVLLHGLAQVAAVTRSVELADEVRVLARGVRRRPNARLSPEECARIALVAAAASAEEGDWNRRLGEWLSELAFWDMTSEEAIDLQSDVHALLELKPSLWNTCGRAEVALASFIATRPQTVVAEGINREG